MGPASVQRRSGSGHTSYSCVLGRWVLLWAALCVVLATPSTVDVGAAAVDGVWRPTSCDDVKEGVVLTNSSDGVRAVIEGCTITVDAGSDATKSAVSIAGLGENSTVELIGCNVTATFSTTTPSRSNRHGTVRVESGAILGDNSRVSIRNTSVSMEEEANGHYGGAVLFDVNIAVGDGFQFQVSDQSVLQATCTNVCGGLLVLGSTGGATRSTFGHRTRLEIADSTITAAATSTAMCVSLAQRVSFGDRSTVSLTATNATARAQTLAISLYLRNDVRLGAHSGLTVEGSTLAATVEVSDAFPVLFSVSIAFGDRSQVKVTDSNLTATAGSENAIPVSFYDSVTFVQGRVAITGSRLVSASSGNSISCLLRSPLSSVQFTVTGSTLEFNGGSNQADLAWRPGAIIAQNDASWDAVSFVVASTSFVAASGSSNKAVFVRWPKTITGVSPQSFDNVTLSSIDANVAQFAIAAAGAIGPQATLCLRDVRAWNGAEISSVALRFAKPTARECWSNTIDVGASAVDGVWRPGSCDDVKGGVVLTNISDGIRAVIESCTIAVDAGSDATTSAVSIAGLGENSSVELIGCSISAQFNTPPISGWSRRRGAVRVETDAVLGNGSKLLIEKTSVAVEEASNVWGTSAVLLDTDITAGDGVDIRVSGGSILRASCPEACCGFSIIGRVAGLTSRSVFGNGTRVTIEDSVVESTAVKYAYPVLLLGRVSFGPHSAFSILKTDITANTQDLNAIAVHMVSHIEFGAENHVTIQCSNVTATSQRSSAYCVFMWNTVTFGDKSKFSVSDSSLTATAEVVAGYVLRVLDVAFSSSGKFEVDNSRLLSSATSESAAIIVQPNLSSVVIAVTKSILQFNGSAAKGSLPTGAVVTSDGATFADVSLAVSDSSFIADGINTEAPVDEALFVLWPKTITGVSPQSFDNVTFSGDGVAPFRINEGGAGPGPNTTLCLRDVRWSNGTAITVGPAVFTKPSPLVCWPITAIDVGASAVGGVWKPNCGHVRNGVVLTNISDGVRVVIEGCTIAVDAGSDATKSAVSIAGLGENSSVELIGCNLTATFNTSIDMTHGALHIERNATLGNGSKLLIDGTAVSMEDSGTGPFGGAVLLDDGITAGDGFQFRVLNESTLTATCSTVCFAVGSISFLYGSVFGRGAVLTLEDSALTTHSMESFAHGLYLRSLVFQEGGALSVTRCFITGTAESNTHNVFLYLTRFEKGSVLSIADSILSATTSYINNAYGVNVQASHFGNGSAVKIAGCNISATAKTSYAYSVLFSSSTFERGSAVSISGGRLLSTAHEKAYSVYLTSSSTLTTSIHSATVISAATFSSAALVLPSLSSTSLSVSSSVVQFNGSAPAANIFSPSGAIVTASSRAWSDVQLSVSSSSFVSTSGGVAAAPFVLVLLQLSAFTFFEKTQLIRFADE